MLHRPYCEKNEATSLPEARPAPTTAPTSSHVSMRSPLLGEYASSNKKERIDMLMRSLGDYFCSSISCR